MPFSNIVVGYEESAKGGGITEGVQNSIRQIRNSKRKMECLVRIGVNMSSNALPRQNQPEPCCALAFGSGSSCARRVGSRPAESLPFPVHFQECALLCVVLRNRSGLLPSARGSRLAGQNATANTVRNDPRLYSCLSCCSADISYF